MKTETLFSLKEAAAYMGWSIHHTRKEMDNGDIPYIKKGRRYFILKEDLEAFKIKTGKPSENIVIGELCNRDRLDRILTKINITLGG